MPGALAGQDRRRLGLQRDRQPPRLAADVPGGRRRAGHRREAASRGHQAGGKTFKVHIDGYNLLPLPDRRGRTKSPRQGFFYFSDDGDLVALRFDNWKIVFMEQRAPGTLRVWAEPFVPLRVPKLFNLRTDPYERADITSNTYYDWLLDHAYLIVAGAGDRGRVPGDVQGVPAAEKAASFTIDQVMEKMTDAESASGR